MIIMNSSYSISNFCYLIKFVFFLITVVNCCSAASECEPGRIVSTLLGDINSTCVQTLHGRSVYAFLGIPFAIPPVGDLRFQEPVPSQPWTGVRDGSKEPPICLQLDVFIDVGQVSGQEDCLYLNVYVPPVTSSRNLPVIVWIYGGAFAIGGGSSNFYGPQMLLNEDVILVTVNYRVGFLGFASLEDDVFPGNNGLKDQNLGLRWVKDNIASFGGNPDSITLAGESAGAGSVHLHMLSPLSRGLFHRAILSSGSADCPWALSPRGVMKAKTKRLASIVSCSQDSSEELLDCLRQVPATSFLDPLGSFIVWRGGDPLVIFAPVFENKNSSTSFMTKEAYLTRPRVPMIIGVNAHEGTFKLAGLVEVDKKLDGILKEFNDNFLTLAPVQLFYNELAANNDLVSTRIKNYYFRGQDISNNTVDEYVRMVSNAFFFQGALASVRRHAGEAYAYKFSYSGDYSVANAVTNSSFRYGISHVDDLIYLFPVNNFIIRNNWAFSDRDRKMSETMVKLYTNFAKHGTPTVHNKPFKWDPVRIPSTNYVEIDGSANQQKNNFLTEDELFWDSLPWKTKLLL